MTRSIDLFKAAAEGPIRPREAGRSFSGIFTYAGALASHFARGDRMYDPQPLNALITGLLSLVSWALQPRSRREIPPG